MAVLGHDARWDADTGSPLDLRPIGDILTDRATSTPHAPALRWPDGDSVRTWSYRELLEESEAFARRLLVIASPGAVAAIFAANSPDWVIFEYGCALAGVTFAPVNPNLTDPEVRHIVDASGAVVIFSEAEFRGSRLLDRARALGSAATVVELAAWRQLPEASGALPSDIDAASALLIQFTSGTTGRPKGAVISHRAAFNCARFQIERLGGTACDSWLNALPLHHVGGSVCVVLTTLACGGATVLAPGFDAGAVLRLIALARPTIIGLVPTMQMALLEHADFASTDVTSLRVVVAGGSVVSTALIERMEAELGATLVNAYGQSESPCAIMTSPDDDALMKAETIGRPLPHRDVRIERADGSTASFGEIGELVMRSPLTMDGYLGGAAARAPDPTDGCTPATCARWTSAV